MDVKARLRRRLTGIFGKPLMGLWFKSCRTALSGEDGYRKLREAGRPVIHLIWHGKIFMVPYFFRRRNIMPLVSPSRDGEIAAQIMERWGYKLLRGSGTHFMKSAWLEMKRELEAGGEVIIVPDGPRGPDRVLKMGCIKLAAETGAVLLPFSFSASKKKILKSWDSFLMFYPFSRVVTIYGPPIEIPSGLTAEGMERERLRVERIMIEFDRETDRFFERKK